MANDEISDIANGIELGDNERDTYILKEDIEAGKLVLIDSDVPTKVKKTAAGSVNLDMLGVLKEHQEVDIDSQIASGVAVDIILKGKFAGFCDAPGSECLPGNLFMANATAAGDLKIMGTGDMDTDEAVAENINTIGASDTVGLFRFLR